HDAGIVGAIKRAGCDDATMTDPRLAHVEGTEVAECAELLRFDEAAHQEMTGGTARHVLLRRREARQRKVELRDVASRGGASVGTDGERPINARDPVAAAQWGWAKPRVRSDREIVTIVRIYRQRLLGCIGVRNL